MKFTLEEILDTLKDLKKLVDEQNYPRIGEVLVNEYEDLVIEVSSAQQDILIEFDKNKYFETTNYSENFYNRKGVSFHISKNINRLKGKVISADSTSILETKEFNFITDEKLRAILKRDYVEIQKSIISECWKAVIVLSGGSIEAILLEIAQRNKDVIEEQGHSKPLEKWDLAELIDICVKLDIVEEAPGKLSHSVREFRNLIHPGREKTSKLQVQPQEATIAVEVLNILIRNLEAEELYTE